MGAINKVITIVSCLFLLFFVLVNSKTKKNEPAKPSATKTVTVKLNVDILPPLQDVLNELEFTSYLKGFVRMGITETRLLLRLSNMDFQLMSMDWNGFSTEHVNKLKAKIAQLMEMATVAVVQERPELEQRKKLTYGKVLLRNGVQAFEYSLASFGAPPPIGAVNLRLSFDVVECEAASGVDYGGDFVLARRGNCTFLTKAQNAQQHRAKGLIVVNTEDKLDGPASGLGIDLNITEAMVKALDSFTVLGMPNTTWEALSRAVQYADDLLPIHIVPIKCQTGGKCLPLLEEEKVLQMEVSWGRMLVRRPASKRERTFEFLTSIMGAPLMVDNELSLLIAEPLDLCSPIANITSASPVALLAHRGYCRFDVKVLHAQQAGARLLVIVDAEDQALQRIGAMGPEIGYLGIPSVLVTAEAGEFIRSREEGDVRITLSPAADSSGFEDWIEIAYTEWADHPQEKLMQVEGLLKKFQDKEHGEIVAWLQRRAEELDFIRKKPIYTDLNEDEL